MALTSHEVEDQGKWEKAVAAVAESLDIPVDTVEKYIIVAYDGTQELKVTSDLGTLAEVVSLTIVLLEHLTGKEVRLF